MTKKPINKPTKSDLEASVAELTAALQRERADAENVRKHAESERSNNIATGKEQMIAKMLPLLDALEKAFAMPPLDIQDNKWVAGVMSLDRQLAVICSDIGLEKVQTVGCQFDPHTMQAVSSDESDEHPADTVIEELQSGYLFGGRLLRPAMVRVSQ